MLHTTPPPLGSARAIKRRFKTERALVTHYLKCIRDSASPSTHLLRTEFDSANGIADIVLVRLRRNWRSNAALGRVSPRWAYALRQIPYRHTFSTGFFEELAGTSRKTTLVMLRHFAEFGYCSRSKKDLWLKRKQPVPLAREIVVIEAKLSDWRRALAQAYRHLDYANKSWVLLDATRSTSAIKHLAQFKRLNVGLITFPPGGRPRTWFSPARQMPRSSLRFWHANSELGRQLRF